MNTENKIKKALDWFKMLDTGQKDKAFVQLVEIAFESEHLNIYDEKEVEEAIEEGSKQSKAELSAPYYRSCGDPIIEIEKKKPVPGKYSVNASISGSKYLGTVDAESEEDAIQKGYDLDTAYCSLCHECSGECEDPHVDEIHVSLMQ